MADKIRGITVEIGGDTNPLNKALKRVNSESKGLQTELRGVESLLKLDPTNVDLIRQKQELLSKSVEGTEEKLEALKRAKEQADADMASGTQVNEREYRNLVREIASTENRLEDLTEETRRFGSVADQQLRVAGDRFQEFGGKLEGAGKAMLPVTGAVIAGGVAAVAAMDAVDEGLDTVMTKTGATGESAKELQDVYNRVATQIPAAFGDIGAAVGEINTRLDFTGDKLEAASVDFLKFAKVNGTDVNTSVQLVSRAMGDAGIAADDYQMVLDSLTVAGQKSGISIDSLATNLAKYGAPMRALGIDTQQAIAMFAGWEKAGVNTETTFGGMKKAISTWGAAGKDSTEEFAKTLDAIKEAPDIASATTLAIEAFGSKAGPDLADAIQAGRFEVDEYIAALQNAGGAVNDTYGMIVDEVDDTQLALQTVQIAMHDVGETIAKSLGPILLQLANYVKAVFDWFAQLSPGMQAAILGFLVVIAAIGPLLIVVGKLSTGIGAIIKILPTLKAGMVALTGPIGLTIAGIVALIAILVTLYAKCEWFRNGVNAALDYLKDKFAFVFDTIKLLFDAFSKLFKGDFDGFLKGILAVAVTWLSGWAEIGKDIVRGVWDGIKNAKDWLLKNVKGWCGSILKGIKAFFGIKSPSRVFRDQVGKNIVLGMAAGIEENSPKVIKSMSELSQHILSEATKWVDDKKFYNQLALADELEFWEELKAMEGLQATELADIDKKIFTAKQSILDQEQKAIDEHVAAVQSRTDALKGFAGLFDDITSDTKVSGKDLLKNLETQVKTFKDWQADIETLRSNGIGGALLEELQSMGPSAAKEIRALTELSDEELAKYGETYAEKTILATQQAMTELGGIVIPIGGVSGTIQDMQANANYAVNATVDSTSAQEAQQKMYETVAQMLAQAVLEGLNFVGNSIFDAIPKKADFNVDSRKIADVTWDAYDDAGDRRRRMFAPSRSEIAAIALAVMPKPIGDKK